ncbi:MAG: protein-disulfide reductase DsbD family protein [Acetobacteraceae bacterium]
MAILLAFLAVLAAVPAWADESAPVRTSRTTATLVTEPDSIVAGRPFRAALRLQMQPGWHTYWKNPGDAGAPPEITFDLPDGASAGPIEWPTPQRLPEGPLMTYAYTGEVLLPVTVTPSPDGGAMNLMAKATWLVCKDICVPEEGSFRVDLPPGSGGPSAQAPLFAAHDRAVPRPSPWEARISPDGMLAIMGAGIGATSVIDAWFIPARSGLIQDDAAQPLSVHSGGFTLALKLAPGFQPENGLDGIVSIRDQAGLQTDLAIAAHAGSAPSVAFVPLPRMLAFAFLGGLILNLMPCVFPILAMKAVALARGASHGRTSAHALAYTAGVLTMFAALAGALLTVRSAGSAAGWGFQFQSPIFVAAMAWLLFGVGLNLSGVFQVGSGLSGVGGRFAGRHGHAGSFFTGLLAVLVATPCTAPFMGVAIAAGLAAPPSVTMLVFLVMGLGLAAPYVALASLPNLGRIMPRPGVWMDVLKQALAFPMYGAAVWLLWVISQEAGASGVLATATGFVLLGFGGWVLGLTQQAESRRRRLGQTLAAAAVLAAIAILPGIAPATDAGRAQVQAGVEAFTPARLASLRQAGQPVFVNMTAAWCITCLVNERVAISTDAVRQAFADRKIVYLKGDWTRQDPVITEYLRQNGRDGVPLYVYYPPDGAPAVMLPQILTEGMVLSALERG